MGDTNATEGEHTTASVQYTEFDVLSELEKMQSEGMFSFETPAPVPNDIDIQAMMERLVAENLSEFSVVPATRPAPMDYTLPGLSASPGAPASYGSTFLLPQNMTDTDISETMQECAENPFDESDVGAHAAPPIAEHELGEPAADGLQLDAAEAVAAAPHNSTASAPADSAEDSDAETEIKRESMSSETEEAMIGAPSREPRARGRSPDYRRMLSSTLPSGHRQRRRQVAREIDATISAVNREVRDLERKLGAAGVTFALSPLQPQMKIPRIIARCPGAPTLVVHVPRQYGDTHAYLTAGVMYEGEQGPENVNNWYMWLADYQRKEMAGVTVSISMIIEKWFAFVQSRCTKNKAS